MTHASTGASRTLALLVCAALPLTCHLSPHRYNKPPELSQQEWDLAQKTAPDAFGGSLRGDRSGGDFQDDDGTWYGRVAPPMWIVCCTAHGVYVCDCMCVVVCLCVCVYA